MGLELLRENKTITKADINPIPLNESSKMIESNGKSYKCVGAYKVDISRYDYLNENNRNYPKKLWEKVIKEQKELWEGSIGLADHPEGDGSVRDIFCVWHNMGMKESTQTVQADMYLVGEYGKLAQEVLEAGGKVELSSSGYGELAENGIDVVAETYTIERPSDWVTNASQRIWATKENEIVTEKEEGSNKNITIKEETKPDKEIKMTEKTVTSKVGNEKITKINEKSLKLNINNMIKDADKIEGLKERVQAYNDILSYCDEEFLVDIKEQVEVKIATIQKEVEKLAEAGLKTPELEKTLKESTEKITESETKIKELTEANEKLQKKIEVLTKMITEGKDNFEQMKEIIELEKATSNSKVNPNDYAILVRESNTTKEENEKLKIQNSYLEAKLKKVFKEAKKEKDDEEDEEMEDEDEKKKEKKKESKSSVMNDVRERRRRGESKPNKTYKNKDDIIEMEFTEKDKIKDYYNKLVERDERYKPYRRDILSCKTYKEAVHKALKLGDEIEYELSESFRNKEYDRKDQEELKESFSDKEWNINKIKRQGWF